MQEEDLCIRTKQRKVATSVIINEMQTFQLPNALYVTTQKQKV